MNDKLLAILIGLLLGMLLVCGGAGLVYAIGASSVSVEPMAVPDNTQIRADIDENYINQTFMDSAASFPSPWPLLGGVVDIKPDNRIGFEVQLDSPLGPMNVTGTVVLTIVNGQIEVKVADAKLGPLPVAGLMRTFMPNMEEEISAEANKMLLERAAQAKVDILAITTDEEQLHAYLASKK